MTQHTPTPWYFGSFPETDDTADLQYDLHAGGSCIATISHLTNADALFMAQAVNAHDALVAASTEALNALMELLPQLRDGVPCADEIKRAVAAQEPLIEALKLAGAA